MERKVIERMPLKLRQNRGEITRKSGWKPHQKLIGNCRNNVECEEDKMQRKVIVEMKGNATEIAPEITADFCSDTM